jgi:hypothetical protein
MTHSRGLRDHPLGPPSKLVEMNCPACLARESIRFNRILRYIDLIQRRGQVLNLGSLPSDYPKEDLVRAEAVLNQIWVRLGKTPLGP